MLFRSYDAIGEIKYAFTMAANVVSRIRLYAALNFEQDAVPTAIDSYRDAQIRKSQDERTQDAAMHQAVPKNITSEMLAYAEKLITQLLTSGPGGQSGFMRAFALNLLVAGECYLVNVKGKWSIRSSSEVVVSNAGQVVLRTQRTGPQSTTTAGALDGDIILPKGASVNRIWREHPRYSGEPDSSMLSIRELCDEVITLQRLIRTIGRAQMNAGLLFLPDGLVAASSSIVEDIRTAEEELDALTTDLYDALTSPIADETHASSVVPVLVTGPAEMADKIKHIPIKRDLDQFLVARLESVIGRVLSGLDVPKDMVEGMSGVRYSNAQAMNGHMYQAQIEPMVLMLCDSLVTVYLRPMMKKQFPQLNPSDLDFFSIWYDPSEVVTKSDPTASADKGLDSFMISGDTWRRAHGFSDSDAPSEKEIAQRYMLAKAPPQPDQIAMLFNQSLPSVVDNARKANMQKQQVPMPASAQKILYGEVIADPNESTIDGKNSPKTAEQAANPVNKAADLPQEDAKRAGLVQSPLATPVEENTGGQEFDQQSLFPDDSEDDEDEYDYSDGDGA